MLSLFDFSVCSELISVSDDPLSMLRGMKGYVLTPSDWEFIQQMKEEKPLQVIVAFSLSVAAR